VFDLSLNFEKLYNVCFKLIYDDKYLGSIVIYYYIIKLFSITIKWGGNKSINFLSF